MIATLPLPVPNVMPLAAACCPHASRPSVRGTERLVQVAVMHALFPHIPGHGLPRPPQLFLSVEVGSSQPFCAFPSQSENPMLHVPTAHIAILQPGAALGSAAHALPH